MSAGGSTTFPPVRGRTEVGMLAGRRVTDLPPTGRTPIGRCSGDIEFEFELILNHGTVPETRLWVGYHRSE
jgi:hypothetical protein